TIPYYSSSPTFNPNIKSTSNIPTSTSSSPITISTTAIFPVTSSVKSTKPPVFSSTIVTISTSTRHFPEINGCSKKSIARILWLIGIRRIYELPRLERLFRLKYIDGERIKTSRRVKKQLRIYKLFRRHLIKCKIIGIKSSSSLPLVSTLKPTSTIPAATSTKSSSNKFSRTCTSQNTSKSRTNSFTSIQTSKTRSKPIHVPKDCSRYEIKKILRLIGVDGIRELRSLERKYRLVYIRGARILFSYKIRKSLRVYKLYRSHLIKCGIIGNRSTRTKSIQTSASNRPTNTRRPPTRTRASSNPRKSTRTRASSNPRKSTRTRASYNPRKSTRTRASSNPRKSTRTRASPSNGFSRTRTSQNTSKNRTKSSTSIQTSKTRSKPIYIPKDCSRYEIKKLLRLIGVNGIGELRSLERKYRLVYIRGARILFSYKIRKSLRVYKLYRSHLIKCGIIGNKSTSTIPYYSSSPTFNPNIKSTSNIPTSTSSSPITISTTAIFPVTSSVKSTKPPVFSSTIVTISTSTRHFPEINGCSKKSIARILWLIGIRRIYELPRLERLFRLKYIDGERIKTSRRVKKQLRIYKLFRRHLIKCKIIGIKSSSSLPLVSTLKPTSTIPAATSTKSSSNKFSRTCTSQNTSKSRTNSFTSIQTSKTRSKPIHVPKDCSRYEIKKILRLIGVDGIRELRSLERKYRLVYIRGARILFSYKIRKNQPELNLSKHQPQIDQLTREDHQLEPEHRPIRANQLEPEHRPIRENQLEPEHRPI
ncbi:hypothetical protein AYI69_g9780, partial [Smittium culicis]